jgi:DNA-damage-inducible protein J
MGREKRIPFEVSVDPFYSESNMRHLQRVLEDANAGRNMREHELIEVDENEETLA